MVCAKIGVPKDELFGFSSRGEITIARKLCIILIRKHISNISDAEVGSHYNRSRQDVHNTEKEFKSLVAGKKNKFHIDLLQMYEELDSSVDNFVKKIKKNIKKPASSAVKKIKPIKKASKVFAVKKKKITPKKKKKIVVVKQGLS